jgi:hypothetical protein
MKKSLTDPSVMRSYDFGGRPVTAVGLLLLISEMEGTSQHLKYMGFKEDMDTINEMKKRYYKLYFKTKKEEKNA